MWKEYKLAPITAFIKVQEILMEAHERKQFIVIIGSSGFGKSVAFQHFYKGTANCFYTDIRPAEAAKPFFLKLNDILNGKPMKLNYTSSTSLNWMIEKSSYDFLYKKENPILIIDEAGNFSKNAQSYLRQVWDNINGSATMVISGPDRYKINLDDWNRDLQSGIPEFISRVDNWHTLPKPSYDDIELICRTNEISDKKVFKYVHENTANLRAVRNLVESYHYGTLDI